MCHFRSKQNIRFVHKMLMLSSIPKPNCLWLSEAYEFKSLFTSFNCSVHAPARLAEHNFEYASFKVYMQNS